MILIVRSKEMEDVLDRLHSMGEKVFVIGEVGKADKEQETIEFV
jgi:phosphoribosylaminoimidazole (AIR) synthetase